jgi:hypothetical protein
VRDAIHDFNERGLAALEARSSRPRRTRSAFYNETAESLRGLLHRSPREFGHDSSLWTLQMAAKVAFEEGLTSERVSGETVRATLGRLLGVRWRRAKRWITSPDPLYERKKASFASDRLIAIAEADPEWAVGFCDECWWSRLALPTLNSWADEGKPMRESRCVSSKSRSPRRTPAKLRRPSPVTGSTCRVLRKRGCDSLTVGP